MPAGGRKHLRAGGGGTADDYGPDTDRYQHVEVEEKEEDDSGRRFRHGFERVGLQIEKIHEEEHRRCGSDGGKR